MAVSIRDKAKKAGSKPGSKPQPAPAKTDAKPKKGKAEPVADTTPASESKPSAVASVTDIGEAVVDRLSDDDVERFLARQASGPLVAGLAATRETKRSQMQYDGKTTDGYVVRVWAPDGAPTITRATLEVGSE